MLMFSVGFFVTIVSIVRLQVLVRFGNSQNLTCKSRYPMSTRPALTCALLRGLYRRRLLVDRRTAHLHRLRLHAEHPKSPTQVHALRYGQLHKWYWTLWSAKRHTFGHIESHSEIGWSKHRKVGQKHHNQDDGQRRGKFHTP